MVVVVTLWLCRHGKTKEVRIGVDERGKKKKVGIGVGESGKKKEVGVGLGDVLIPPVWSKSKTQRAKQPSTRTAAWRREAVCCDLRAPPKTPAP